MSYNDKLMLMSVFFVLSLVFGLSGCTFTETTSNATTNSKANSTADGKTATAENKGTNDNKSNTTANTATAAETASTPDSVGIAECDEYIRKYEACMNSKVPEAQREALETSFAQQRKGFKDAATDPQAGATLASSCKTMIETARSSMSAYGCEW